MRHDLEERLASSWRRAVAPPAQLTVSEWADKHRRLSSKESSEAGRWRTARTPYLRQIMDAFGDPDIDEVIIRKCSQAGVSEAARNVLGYWITQDPGPCLWVMPSEQTAREAVDERIRPMIRHSIPHEVPTSPRDMSLAILRLRSMELYIGWSGSPASLATRAVRYCVLDELDKFRQFSGHEGGPVALARARTRTFAHRRKIIMISTPTTRDAQISREYELCADRREYFMPCGACKEPQLWTWERVRYPSVPQGERAGNHAERVGAEQLARWECPACGAENDEAQRQRAILRGEWRSCYDGRQARRVAFQLTALSNPWANLSELAAKWLASDNNVGAQQEFENQELARPFEQRITQIESSEYRRKRLANDEGAGVVPAWASVVIASADTQRDGYWWMVRAWGPDFRSRLLDWGFADDLAELRAQTVDNRFTVAEGGGELAPRFLLIDSGGTTTEGGSMTDQVYRFSLTDWGRIIPTKGTGADRPAAAPIQQRRIKYTPPGMTKAPYEIQLSLVDVNYYKDVLAHRIGADDVWQEDESITDDYCAQMSSERKIVTRRGSKVRQRWVAFAGVANHLWDVAVLQCAGADLAAVQLMPTRGDVQTTRQQTPPPPRRRDGGFISRRDDRSWIQRR